MGEPAHLNAVVSRRLDAISCQASIQRRSTDGDDTSAANRDQCPAITTERSRRSESVEPQEE